MPWPVGWHPNRLRGYHIDFLRRYDNGEIQAWLRRREEMGDPVPVITRSGSVEAKWTNANMPEPFFEGEIEGCWFPIKPWRIRRHTI